MDENKNGAGSQNKRCCKYCSAVPFLLGLVIALAFGWFVFPDLMFSKKPQPVLFTHKTHIENVGMSCNDCHSFADNGYFKGVPTLESCDSCHADLDSLQTPEPDDEATKMARKAEIAFITDYVLTGKEVPWKVHQKQPDNVFFSHAVHLDSCLKCHKTMKGDLNLGTHDNPQKLCQTCHPSLDELDKQQGIKENVLTSYSATTMKMWECEKCHAHPGHFSNDGKGRTTANNACFTCHK